MKKNLTGKEKQQYFSGTKMTIIVLSAILFLCAILFTSTFYKSPGTLFRSQYDDAYITYRYAVNLANSKGLVFNAGEKTDAASSFLYTVILATFFKAGFHDLEAVSVMIQILSAALLSVLVFLSVFHITQNPWVSAFMGILGVTHGFISGWAISGMETVFYAFLVTLFCYLYFIRNFKIISTATLLLILLTRTEGIIVVFVWFVTEIAGIIIGFDRKKTKTFLLHAAIVASVIVFFYAWRYCYYGTILPHSLAMKRIIVYYKPDPGKVFDFWLGYASMITCLGLASVSMNPFKKCSGFFLLLYISISSVSFLVGPDADKVRYTVHIYPLLVILSGITVVELLKYRKLMSVVIFIAVLMVVQTARMTISMRSFVRNLVEHQECRKQVGAFLNKNVDKSNIIISSDIGAIGYEAMDFTFIDLTGLTSADVLKRYQNHENVDDIIKEKKPFFIADTFRKVKDGVLNYPMLKPETFLKYEIPETGYTAVFETIKPLHICTADSTLYFVVAQIHWELAQ